MDIPSGPAGPVGPVAPVAPAGPCSPSGPADPSGPAAPCGPAGPSGPAGPCSPSGPADPCAPASPAGPRCPAGPSLPEHAATKSTPAVRSATSRSGKRAPFNARIENPPCFKSNLRILTFAENTLADRHCQEKLITIREMKVRYAGDQDERIWGHTAGAARVARLPADPGPVLTPLARYSYYGKGALSDMCLTIIGGIVKGG